MMSWVAPRAFAREDMRPGARNSALFIGKIVLEDGCFRLARPASEQGSANPLVMFDYVAQLAYDDEGRVIVTGPWADSTSGYRIGEQGAWGGPAGYSDENPDVIRLRHACGDGEIVNVTMPQSNRLFSLPDPTWVTGYAHANGLLRQAAGKQVVACMDRQWDRGRTGLDAHDRCIRQFN